MVKYLGEQISILYQRRPEDPHNQVLLQASEEWSDDNNHHHKNVMSIYKSFFIIKEAPSLWNIDAPRIPIFRAAKIKRNVLRLLMKKGWPGDMHCLLRGAAVETINHLLLGVPMVGRGLQSVHLSVQSRKIGNSSQASMDG